MAALFSTFAIGNVLPEMAVANPESGPRDFGRAFAKAAGLAALPSVGLAVLVTLPELSRSFDPIAVSVAITLAAAGSVLLAFRAVSLSVFASGSAAARFQFISAAVTSATIVIAVFTAPIAVLPLAIGAGVVLGPIIGVVSTRSFGSDAGGGREISAGALIRRSLPTYGSSLLSAGAVAVAPLIMLNLAGAAPTGLLRAVTSLGGLPSAVVIPAIALHFYPIASQRMAAGEAIDDVVSESVGNLAGKASLGAVALAVAAPLALWLAYSASFVSAAAALAVIACAGAIRAVGLHGAYLLLAAGRRRAYLAAESCAAGVLLIGTVLAGLTARVVGASIAVWLSAAAYLAFVKIALGRPRAGGVQVNLRIPLRVVVLQLLAIAAAVVWGVLLAHGVLR
ncbi:MAG: hypothetical protein LWW77_00715 [Propionibacteriales bacterium]|nr:hypothetical protein [Propionibacteriales bacterium]